MQRLTKEIAESIRKKYEVGDFYYYGNIRGYEFFRALRIHGGKTGFPVVFGIDDTGNIQWVKDYETLEIVRDLSSGFEQVPL